MTLAPFCFLDVFVSIKDTVHAIVTVKEMSMWEEMIQLRNVTSCKPVLCTKTDIANVESSLWRLRSITTSRNHPGDMMV